MIFADAIYFLGFVASLLIIVFAIRARCWLLFIGYLLQVPVDLQVLFRKLERILGFAHEDVPPYSVFLNRILAVGTLVFTTVGLLQLLHRYARLRSRPPPSPPHASNQSLQPTAGRRDDQI
jgi:hypothetical protein